MSFTKRLQKEYVEITKSSLAQHCILEVSESNILSWNGVLHPTAEPFSKFSFKINIQFPSEYPFKPPKIIFVTPIYHPNIDEKGQICLPIITSENWKPSVKVELVIQSLLALLNDPDAEHGINTDVAKEYMSDKSKYLKNALEHCQKHAQPL